MKFSFFKKIRDLFSFKAGNKTSSICAFICIFLFCMPVCGCSQPVETAALIQEDVDFSLSDVLRVENEANNTVFYYFLASIDNRSDQDYHMSNLEYVITDQPDQNAKGISPIDQYQAVVSDTVRPGMSTFIYGYIGIPNGKYKDLGLYLPQADSFLSFSAGNVRTIEDDKITHSADEKFTIYEDEYFSFDVDSSNTAYHFENGTSVVDGLTITYHNNTDDRLVIPYLTPSCVIDGLKLSSLPNQADLAAMDQEQIMQQDFHSGGLEAKTEAVQGDAYGYQLFYLPAQQEVSCNISFVFEDVIPDFSAANHNDITIHVSSYSLGYDQIIKVDY